MSKINIFLFAAHHSSANIAAQRFKSLVKYLDPAIYNIHVFTRSIDAASQAESTPEWPNVTVHAFDGQCVGDQSSLFVMLIDLLSAFLTKLPFVAIRFRRVARLHSSWMLNALAVAESICRNRLAEGKKCFAIGTYSPIDALIAARCLSVKFALPHLQDFRDGFVFESLGRKGTVASWVRSVIERRVVAAAAMVTNVSAALVDDFRRRYPWLKVALLPNGYDPADFDLRGKLSAKTVEIADEFPADKILIGHFGRISGSDQSSLIPLNYLIKLINSDEELVSLLHLIFIGNLTTEDLNILSELKCTKTIKRPVERNIAIELMGRCNILLLITGDRTSCATGKIFEYMASGPRIICCSAVRNEAANILEDTNCGITIFTGHDESASAFFHEISSIHRGVSLPQRDISKYSRISQSAELSCWIQEICL